MNSLITTLAAIDIQAIALGCLVLGFCLGFFFCALFAASSVRDAENDGWITGYSQACQDTDAIIDQVRGEIPVDQAAEKQEVTKLAEAIKSARSTSPILQS